MTDPEPGLRLTITPEPTEDEAAAVAAAIALLTAAASIPTPATRRSARPSRWSLSGRIAAHDTSPASLDRRWSRSPARPSVPPSL